MARFWLGPWQWDVSRPLTPFWRAPTGSVGSLDLRSVPQCATPLLQQGFGFFVTPNAVTLGSDYINLGTDPEAVLTEPQLRRWESALALPSTLAMDRLADVVYETLTAQADPTGDDRCCPLVATTRRRFEVWIAGAKVRDRAWAIDAPEFVGAPRDLLRRIYRRLREASQAGTIPPDKYRRWLGYQVRKYGLSGNQYEAFQPLDLRGETPLDPQTTVSDDFNRADTDTPSGWTEVAGDWDIVTNQMVKVLDQFTGETEFGARYDTALSSDDHYSQSDHITSSTNTVRAGPAARFSNSAFTTYWAHTYLNEFHTMSIRKMVSGVDTALANYEDATPPAYPHLNIKLECDGSTLTLFEDGTQRAQVTDTAISGNLNCGLVGSADETSHTFDNFIAADLAAAGGTVPKNVFGLALDGPLRRVVL